MATPEGPMNTVTVVTVLLTTSTTVVVGTEEHWHCQSLLKALAESRGDSDEPAQAQES